MAYKKQHELGLAGLALLRNWLVGDEDLSKSILGEIQELTTKTEAESLVTRKEISSYNISKGYTAWADTYDNVPNLLIEVEEPIVKSILHKFPPGDALDAACGTGRYSEFLNSLGYRVTGVDFSPAMLSQARKKRSKQIRFIQGNLTTIPLKDRCVDLVICALVLTHFSNTEAVLSELYRVVRPGGHIIISDIHPWLVVMGGQAEFFDKSGKHCYIANYVHWHSSYFQSFNQLGLKVIQCVEPIIKQEHIKLAKTGFDLSEKTVSTALKDLPLALIWVLEKQ